MGEANIIRGHAGGATPQVPPYPRQLTARTTRPAVPIKLKVYLLTTLISRSSWSRRTRSCPHLEIGNPQSRSPVHPIRAMAELSPLGTSKVAISRLQRHGPEEPPSEKKEEPRKPRVGRACLSCRHRKIKCTGDSPRCANCIASDLDCVYDQARRDRLKSATSRNRELAQLLRDLSSRVDDADRALIQDALEGYEDDSTSAVSNSSAKRRKLSSPEEHEGDKDGLPLSATARAPSSRSEKGIAHVNEDLLRSRKSRETGYVGKGAEVHWLHSLQDQMSASKPDQDGQGSCGNPTSLGRAREGTANPAASVTDATFYLDSDSAELQMEVNPRDLPPVHIAEKLLECYMITIHKSFPILPDRFEDQFQGYFQAVKSGRPLLNVPDQWLAILNVVFAIGARYSHLIGAEWRGEERDHLTYMTRAIRLLGSWPFATAPSLATIQVTGLLSFYYQVIGHVSRGWVMIGIAIRLALALGLHLRNEDPKTSVTRKETLLRTWWSLHAIECLLSTITGRPCVLAHEDCTVPLPLAFAEEMSRSASSATWDNPSKKQSHSPIPASSNNSAQLRRLQEPRTYLDAHLNIGLITQKLMSSLYSPRTAQHTPTDIQSAISSLLHELDEWKQGALPEDDRLRAKLYPSLDGPREILLLSFSYFSTRILITRPCLCRSARGTQDQNQCFDEFYQRMADECVDAALGMADLLPNFPDVAHLYRMGPWWSIVHNFMQAIAVLLLELSYGEKSRREDHDHTKDRFKRILRRMRLMRHDAVVVRAYAVLTKLLQLGKFQAIASDLLSDEGSRQENFLYTAAEAQEPRSNSSQAFQTPLPSAWHSGYYPAQSQGGEVGFNHTEADPLLQAGFGQPPMHPEIAALLNHPRPEEMEQLQFQEDPFTTQYLFANPFTSQFDVYQPFGLGLDDLNPQSGFLGNGDLSQQHISDYPNFQHIDEHQQTRNQQPH
ncbi:hypothetical protein BU23DRAFT_280974 [Bimuria novae-zelandiae CBS 107.79]|uniref:Zn(2)-C6 fungal-type domain-containing protein n=1 Tax=Bimuria novae-zelandiae CBS 107.79 TaxID=1447943 RepID=A0A6A5UT24_9PLEO|nr:hypothetical protein BU23DRAFT_280974 [Bimuria novae-zelandiae CBS 107.79]